MAHIHTIFEPRYHGVVHGKRASLVLGPDANEFGPYDLVLAGLSGCFYVTFLGITGKMQLSYDEVTIDITGTHREEPPTLLSHVLLDIIVKGAGLEREKHFNRAVEVASKYCSVFQTLSRVAEMETKLTLIP
ncbi:MAG TPA: OsmC family protein [Clostridia bacterium]|nr:OsmC family protein [Clostridia bacterium]